VNKNIIDLAQQAGFALWGDEHWSPGDTIDWSSHYDNEFTKYSESLIREVLLLQQNGTDVLSHFGLADSASKETVEIELTDQELLALMKLAHEQDITFNKLVENGIQQMIESLQDYN
jgi:hypothetical protein